MRVAFIRTCDCTGLGHRARAAAIERAMARSGRGDVLRTFGQKEQHIRAWRPDLAVVDMRWRGIREFACPAWLLVRATTSSWDGFDPARWERVIGIEPGATGPLTDEVPPVVMVNPDEVSPGPFDGRTVVMHAGPASEVEALCLLAGPGAFVIGGEPWPAARSLPSAARIYAGGGYNSVWEARWLDYAERTTFVPFRRGDDDQAARIAERTPMTGNGADVIARWIA
jgi:hypothetical protein